MTIQNDRWWSYPPLRWNNEAGVWDTIYSMYVQRAYNDDVWCCEYLVVASTGHRIGPGGSRARAGAMAIQTDVVPRGGGKSRMQR